MEGALTRGSLYAELLERGIPAKLREVSDCPIDSSVFEDFRRGALECFDRAERLLVSEPAELTVEDWPVIAFLFAHEDPLAPYTSELCCIKAEELMNKMRVRGEIVDKLYSVIKPRLLKGSWQFHIGERYILKSICKRFPDPGQQLELISNISGSHLPENQRIAAVCLTYLAQAFPIHDHVDEDMAFAVLEALMRLTRGRDSEVLGPAFKGIHYLLFSAQRCHVQRSPTFRYILRNGSMAITLEEKLLYARVLGDFVASLKFAAREHTNMILDVLEYWTSAESTRHDALLVLHLMLTEGAVTDSWYRVAKILLDCAVSCSQGDESIGLVTNCRETLRMIRSSEESAAERKVFARLTIASADPDEENVPCRRTLQ